MNKIIVFVAVFLCSYVQAQQIGNVTSALARDGTRFYYEFTYSLEAGMDNVPAFVKLKIKAADREFYATDVTGDVGEMVYPGVKKIMRWDYGRELVHFSGDIEYTIETVPMVAVPLKVKRGKELTVNVREYLASGGDYVPVLYRNKAPVWGPVDSLRQGNSFTLVVPKKTKVKKGYQIGLSRGEERYFSNTFKIRPRVSRWLYALAGAAVAVPVILKALEPEPPLPGAPDIED
ncbi:MAG: hypothetical protein BroJett042_17380 [Bacteroidota bacterium]|nr:MAG: hypothetical protein BroJett042_17380 [Bacteroidota bacterium]